MSEHKRYIFLPLSIVTADPCANRTDRGCICCSILNAGPYNFPKSHTIGDKTYCSAGYDFFYKYYTPFPYIIFFGSKVSAFIFLQAFIQNSFYISYKFKITVSFFYNVVIGFDLKAALMASNISVLTSCADVKWYVVYIIFYFAVCNKNKKI